MTPHRHESVMSSIREGKAVPNQAVQPSFFVMIANSGHNDNVSPETNEKKTMIQVLPGTCLERERRTVMTQQSTRILVLGAGVAGLLFTLRLAGKVARESVQITLVDASDTFTLRPRLHEL